MYYYEKDYIMRLIHGIARMLARMLFGRILEDDDELVTVIEEECRKDHDYLRQMVDQGQINAVIAFYDYVNEKTDEFLAEADFSRDEIISGLEDAMKALNMEIPEYLRI